MQEPIKDANRTQPVNFAELLEVIFWGMLRAVRGFFSFLWRNKILLTGCLVAGGIIGFTMWEITPTSYKFNMVLRHTELKSMTIGHMLDNLDGLARTGSYSELSKTLKSGEGVVSHIGSIRGKNLMGEKLISDTSKLTDEPFIIEVSLSDKTKSDTIEHLILKYFNENEYLNKLKNDRATLIMPNLEFINSELQRLDSLKQVYNRFLSYSKGSPMFYNNAFNPAEIYSRSAEYYGQKNGFEEWLAQNRLPVVSIDGSEPFATPQSRGLFTTMAIYAFIFFFIGSVLAGIKEIPR